MSVGATEKQLRNSVVFEGICIGLIGIPAGMLIGIPGIRLVLSLVAKTLQMYSTVMCPDIESVCACPCSFRGDQYDNHSDLCLYSGKKSCPDTGDGVYPPDQ